MAGLHQVNRRTGGLEITPEAALKKDYVNRRTGGLEKRQFCSCLQDKVNRRTGGLEIDWWGLFF